MMLVGFGYLMTFLRWYGMGAVGLTMMITCVGMLFAIAVEPFFKEGGVSSTHKIPIDLTALIDGDFAVATFLISFGGLIGKVGPAQPCAFQNRGSSVRRAGRAFLQPSDALLGASPQPH